MNPIYDLLRADGSIVVNKSLIAAIGLNEAIVFSELLSRYYFFKDREQLQKDGSFFNTIFDLSLATGLADKAQRTAITKLKKLKLIDVIVKGIPAKRYFKICDNQSLIEQYLLQGKAKLQKIIEKHKENPLSITVLPKAETCYPQGQEVLIAEGPRNNTKYNNTKGIIQSTYIDLPIDEHVFLKIYGEYYRRKFNKKHMRLSEESLSLVNRVLDEYNLYDLDEETFEEEVVEHFDNLPESNNGNILPFLKASKRHFDIDVSAIFER